MRRVICAALCVAAVHVVPASAAEPTNGQLVATEGIGRLVTFNADGSALRTIFKPAGEYDFASQPVWSPDGNAIAFASWDSEHDSRIAVYDLRTGKVRTVTDHPGPVTVGVFTVHTEDWDPGWTPDGRVAFRRSTYDTEKQTHVLMTVAADGTGLEELPIDPLYGGTVSWSRDGWVLHADGDNYLHITSLEGDDEVLPFTGLGPAATWSPDGEWFADADRNVFVVSLDGDAYDLTTPPAKASDSSPAWAPDGGSLVYKRSTQGTVGVSEELRVYDLETGADRKVIGGNLFGPAWQPCVAGVTVSCKSQPVRCDEPNTWDPKPACVPAGPVVVPPVPHPSPAPPSFVPSASAQFDRHTKLVTLRVSCVARCTLSARLSVRLTTGRVLKTRVVQRTGRAITLRIKLPAVPKRRKVASIRVVGSTTDAKGVTRALIVPVRR